MRSLTAAQTSELVESLRRLRDRCVSGELDASAGFVNRLEGAIVALEVARGERELASLVEDVR